MTIRNARTGEKIRLRVLVIDVGGTNVKILASGFNEVRRFSSGPELTPPQLIKGVRNMTAGLKYDVVTIGCPAPVVHNKLVLEPVNLGGGWLDYDFNNAFGRPVKLVNDAAMQAIGSYQGGRMLFLGLGTGLGTAAIFDNVVIPMEAGHLPYRRSTFEDHIGIRGLKHFGKKRWRELVADVVARLMAALTAEYVVLGGGHVKFLKELPAGARAGNNANAFKGGFRLWEEPERFVLYKGR
ncbi:MAG: ROK family protein [bacterium]|nr:ROK family protein [Candidatus Sumerlaeota bacterium]